MNALELADYMENRLVATNDQAANMLRQQHSELALLHEAIKVLREAVQFLIETSSYEAEVRGEQALKDTEGLV